MNHPEREAGAEPARYVMIGGFLGAGKTTAIGKLARYLADRGKRVGLICNDQSEGLVDTAILRTTGLPVQEITGGCFCCRFGSLVEAADSLSREAAPDVFLAEPVGSCTDLVATVSYPLRRIYGDRFTVAPLSVLVDPRRAARVLGIDTSRSFSEKVLYVYRKQLEEADVLVVNKCDSIDPELRDAIVEGLRREYPAAEVRTVSAKEGGADLEAWFEAIRGSELHARDLLEIDYDEYAEGEALLGWLNLTVRVTSNEPFDANRALVELAADVRSKLDAEGAETAHLKMTLDSGDGSGSLSVVSLVDNRQEPDLRESLLDRVAGGELVINLRAEADPEFLRAAVESALSSLEESSAEGLRTTVEHLERLRPGRPVPTHRMAATAAGPDATQSENP